MGALTDYEDCEKFMGMWRGDCCIRLSVGKGVMWMLDSAYAAGCEVALGSCEGGHG